MEDGQVLGLGTSHPSGPQVPQISQLNGLGGLEAVTHPSWGDPGRKVWKEGVAPPRFPQAPHDP